MPKPSSDECESDMIVGGYVFGAAGMAAGFYGGGVLGMAAGTVGGAGWGPLTSISPTPRAGIDPPRAIKPIRSIT